MPINHEKFFSMLGSEFPEVVSEIDEYAKGSLHCEMAALIASTTTLTAPASYNES